MRDCLAESEALMLRDFLVGMVERVDIARRERRWSGVLPDLAPSQSKS